ncbi:MAG: cytochrome b/b6 domain-containing protein [Oligoflexales bacterium]|nr:cytochrome b/b6 domain-containing protein [Oligoflexales bacterium]
MEIKEKFYATIWSLPIRAFHWLLVALVAFNYYTGKWGDGVDSMDYHEKAGIALLTLLAFRVLWGFWGDTSARFTYFVPTPKKLIAYIPKMFKSKPSGSIGHSPSAAMGALMLIFCLLVQSISGLFTTDDILTEGPLCSAVDSSVCSFFTQVHYVNSYVLVVAIGLHLAALAFYGLYKKENLIPAMFFGKKGLPHEFKDQASKLRFPKLHFSLLTLVGSGILVWLLVYSWA